MGAATGMEMGARWAGRNPSHPSFHYRHAAAQNAIRLREVYEQQQQQQQQMLLGGTMGLGAPMDMGIGMGMRGATIGMQIGVATGRTSTRRRAVLERLTILACLPSPRISIASPPSRSLRPLIHSTRTIPPRYRRDASAGVIPPSPT
ncbi:hypothetical protein C8R47DRAFT_1221917 [Mycena vitilis]|nr:hypothetical protein C8R47DRAFT_1221917 [Mycena vitilis]